MLKKICLGIFFIILMSINSAFAANWIQVNASNGKSAALDSESIEIDGNIVRYWVKTTIGSNIYRYYMMSDFTAHTSCIAQTLKYNKKGELLDKSQNQPLLEQIVPDSLNEALYNKVCELVRKSPLSVNTNSWNLYFGNIKDQISKLWKPKSSKTKNENLSAFVMFRVNKQGEILDKVLVTPSQNEKYDKSVQKALDNLTKFAPLPGNYDGEVEFVFEFKYVLKGDKPESMAIMGEDGVGEISLVKSKFHAGEFILNCIGVIIALPIAILGALLGM